MAKTKQEELTIEQATQLLDEKSALIKQLQADLKEQADLVAEIRKSNANPNVPTFEYEGTGYKVVAGQFTLGENTHTAQDVCENIELQKQLIALESGVIVKVTEQ